MDSLTYKYNLDVSGNLVNNKLDHVNDQVSSSNYSVDIDNQSAGNYGYDEIGNLKKDAAESIDTIRWTVYGKINKIVKNGGSTNINYRYDAGGNRTTKVVSGAADTTTFYIRDAQGNVLAVYTKKGTDSLKWNEQHLYGSSRLGMWLPDTLPASPPIVIDSTAIQDSLMMGSRIYEVTNQLGNILSTISDKKIGNDSSGVVNYYIAEVLSQTDYYPGGMLQPERTYTTGNDYRYSVNGQEKEKEINKNITSAEFWMYDSRIVRRWNVDPVVKVQESPYLCFSGNPVWLSDPRGDSTPVRNRIFDNRGNEITTPTVINLAPNTINPQQFPGMKPVGNNRVLVTPGSFMAEFDPSSAVGSTNQVFIQVPGDVSGGNLYTWNHSLPVLPFAATPTFQYNNQITGVQNVNGPVGNINRNFNIAFNPASGTANAARFTNPGAGIAQINTFANRLTGLGISSGVNITIGTDFSGAGSPSNQFTNAGGLVAARGRYIQGLFAARGVSINLRPPAWGTTPNINARINANVIGLIGWNVTTQAMQRQVLRGNVLPGTTLSVPGSAPGTNFQRNTGGAPPAVGSFTGPWQ